MLKRLLLVVLLVMSTGVLTACDKAETPTSPSVTYPPVAINPLSAHMSVGDTVTFTASGGNSNYQFSLIDPGSGLSLSLEYFEAIRLSSNEFRLKLVRKFPHRSVVVRVRSWESEDRAYIYNKE